MTSAARRLHSDQSILWTLHDSHPLMSHTIILTETFFDVLQVYISQIYLDLLPKQTILISYVFLHHQVWSTVRKFAKTPQIGLSAERHKNRHGRMDLAWEPTDVCACMYKGIPIFTRTCKPTSNLDLHPSIIITVLLHIIRRFLRSNKNPLRGGNVCPWVRELTSAPELLDTFSMNFMSENFSKIYQAISMLVKIGQKKSTFHTNI